MYMYMIMHMPISRAVKLLLEHSTYMPVVKVHSSSPSLTCWKGSLATSLSTARRIHFTAAPISPLSLPIHPTHPPPPLQFTRPSIQSYQTVAPFFYSFFLSFLPSFLARNNFISSIFPVFSFLIVRQNISTLIDWSSCLNNTFAQQDCAGLIPHISLLPPPETHQPSPQPLQLHGQHVA